MKENKNIERLFQEKFKDFEVSPPEFVWENIQEKLNPKENKRRVIPFWFKNAGIAASFVAIVSVVFYNSTKDFNNTNTINNNNTVVNSGIKKENKTSNQNGNKENIGLESNKNQNNSNASFNTEFENNSKTNTIVTNNSINTNSKTNYKSDKNKSNSFDKNGFDNNSKSNSVVTNTSKNKVSNSKTNYKTNKNSLQNSSSYKATNGLVKNNKKQQSNQNKFKKNKAVYNNSDSGIAVNNKRNKNKSTVNKFESNSSFNDFNTSKNNSSITDITSLNSNKDFNSSKNNNSNSGLIDVNKFNPSNITSPNNNTGLVENNSENSNNPTTNSIAIEEIKNDTLLLATVIIEENPMEKLLREKETKKVVDEKEKGSKWAVNSYVSPIFFNSFASGSPISDEFASNEKSFNNSTSYGVGVAYNLSKRLSVKAGVSNLKLDYDTENIAFYSSFEDQSKISNTNIERNSNGKYLVLKHEKDVSRDEVETQFMQTSQNSGVLNQKTQYVEVPLELSYAILNKKFGIAIKGGMSTLFLTENVVSIVANDGNMQIGKASNLNNVHFSSNLGLGLSYNFMKNFQLNLEPTLKYQINTFNKNSEDFTPYVIGVNTGISYKF